MNNNQYLVSICVPIFGVEKYIKRCAISLFEQTYKNIEYIFVNDCTQDKSIEILQDIIHEYPDRKPYVKIINHNKNLGLGASRNTAVEATTGEFLMHVDSDDWINKDCVELCVKKQKESNADIINFDSIKHLKGNNLILRQSDITTPYDLTLKILKRTAPIMIWSRLIRTQLYKNNKIAVDKGINMSEDYQVIPKLVFNAKIISVIHTRLYHYNCINDNSYCSTSSWNNTKQILHTCNNLTAYFSHRNPYLLDAINEGKIKVLTNQRIIFCRKNDKESFLKATVYIMHINKRFFKTLPLSYRIFLLIKNFKLSKLYVCIADYFKHLIN